MIVELYLRGGAVVRFESERIETKRSPVTDELVGLSWKTPEGARRKLMTVPRLEEIVAVVVERDELEEPADRGTGGTDGD